jgi:MoaA/NifB/PqqE/SkfB family radical SAM enzyme
MPGETGTATRHLVPVVCDVSVTNVCNATCDFCCFAYDKQIIKDKRWLDGAEFARALPILYRRGVRYLNFQGGEPLLHPKIDGLVADTRAAGMRPGLITNGWLLPQKIESLVSAGLGGLLVSIDSHSLAEHERNRGLQGVGERIHEGLAVARQNGIPTMACVTVSRLVKFEALPDLLQRLGFDEVVFSWPRRAPLGSSSMVFNPDSALINFKPEELVQAVRAVKSLRKRFPVRNPAASMEDVERYIRGEKEQFGCVGGHKYFYLDWNLNIWRCEAWSKPLGSVFNFDQIPDCRDRCTACMMACYRNASVLMHAGVAVEDAAAALEAREFGKATQLLFRRTVVQSLGAVLGQVGRIARVVRERNRWGPVKSVGALQSYVVNNRK